MPWDDLEELFRLDTPLSEKAAALLPPIERAHEELTVAKAKAEALGDEDEKVRFMLMLAELDDQRNRFRAGLR